MPEAAPAGAGTRSAWLPGSGVRLACDAMRTRFELLLQGGSPARLRAAGEEAVATICDAEARLSRFRPTSDVARINGRAAHEAVVIEPSLFALLEEARRLHAVTGGAFDVTIAPLMHCWGFTAGGGSVPADDELERARACVGMHLVDLDESRRTVRFTRPGVQLDLGGIAKGWALDRAALALRELGIEHALLHGGTSSVYGLGQPIEGGRWRVAIESPATAGGPPYPLGIVALEDRALGVSAVWGRSFAADDAHYGHVLDPLSGRPVQGALLAAAACASATEADALSTALLTLGAEGGGPLLAARPDVAALVLERGPGRGRTWRRRITLVPEDSR